ncbi:MAG: hypothetical protein D6771_00680 [Zetaproteobacteria bacterium]|nr:MAG: hypothetical protein D6771_00680 [Zetaproteobacteria bacterium]
MHAITVATVNLQAGVGTERAHQMLSRAWRFVLPHPDTPVVLAQAAAALAAADIVAVQEADAGSLRVAGRDLLHELGRLGSWTYSAAMTTRRWGAWAAICIGVLSRWPIVHTEAHRLPGSRHGRGAIVAQIRTPIGEIAVICTHWSLRERARLVQAETTAAIARSLSAPVVLMGDLNCTPAGTAYRRLCEQANLHGLRAAPPTWPSWRPRRAIDHILCSPELRCVEAHTLHTRFSDHLPLVARLRRRPPTPSAHRQTQARHNAASEEAADATPECARASEGACASARPSA